MALRPDIGNDLPVKDIQGFKQWVDQYITYDKFSDLRGSGFGSAIVAKGIKEGNFVQYDMGQYFYDLVVTPYGGQISGTGKEPTVATYYNKIGPIATTTAIKYYQYKELVTGYKIKGLLKDLLTENLSRNNFRRTIQSMFMAACYKTTTSLTDFTVAPLIYTYDTIIGKLLASTMVTTSAQAQAVGGDVMSHSRIVFGNDFNNGAGNVPTNATIAATIGQGAFTVANGHGATLDFFDKMRSLARIGSRAGSKNTLAIETPIRPIKETTDSMGYLGGRYAVVISEGMANFLRKTQDWKDLLIRPFVEDAAKQPSYFKEGSYMGTVNGNVFIVEPELDNYALNATTHICFLIGSMAIAHSTTPLHMTIEESNHKVSYELAIHETLGIRPFMFPSTSDVTAKGDLNKLLVSNIVVGIAKIA